MSRAQRREFVGRGFLPVGRVAALDHLQVLKGVAAHLAGLDGNPPALDEDHLMRADRGDVRVALHLCHRSPVFRLNATGDHIAGMVSDLLGEPAAVLTSLLFCKPPAVGLPLRLHQDLPYYPYLGDQQLITCWTALDDADSDNGAVEYIPGSHLTRLPHRTTGEQQALDIPDGAIDTSRATTVPVKAGEAVLHHGLTAHRSGANHSNRPRMGLATLYVPASVTITADQFPYPLLTPRSTS
ncbi:phytanoyl-CoA dioxygenase family protein [Pilimelia columellifera]|uniref:phytanoyl-CoA dioxygenase family protein n=1 Tax=Pilimelia columellifera TaxID=706574 RepID=UPI0031D15EDE